jgi:hypothetical protein
MLMTCPQRRYEATSEDVTWRDVTSKSSIEDQDQNFMKQMGPPASMNIKWHLNDAKVVVTSKVDKVDILNILNDAKRRRHF